jgi:hypothetical protein
MRVRFWDASTGSEIIGDWSNGQWVFAEREWGGVCWYDLLSRPELVKAAEAEAHKQRPVGRAA